MTQNTKLTKDDYSILELAFASLRKDQFANEAALVAIINLKAKVFSNLTDYDNFLEEREKPSLKMSDLDIIDKS